MVYLTVGVIVFLIGLILPFPFMFTQRGRNILEDLYVKDIIKLDRSVRALKSTLNVGIKNFSQAREVVELCISMYIVYILMILCLSFMWPLSLGYFLLMLIMYLKYKD